MPVRTYSKNLNPLGLPHDLNLNGCDTSNDEELEKFSRSLPFIDLNTALHKRIVTRDPICGVGDLPPEINPMDGHKLRCKAFSACTSPGRDPILLMGDLGVEYNCLYTTRDLHCKERQDRNILTLDGNLGEELDPLRPHGGRPRNSIKNDEVRNPITGVGEYRKEWDPIWKYEGRHIMNRPEQKKRDPITHTVPMENMGEHDEKYHLRMFSNYNDEIATYNSNEDTDIISHHYENPDSSSQPITISGIRQFATHDYRDPITHETKLGSPEEAVWRPGTKHFLDKRTGDDPISHHGYSDDITAQHKKEEEARNNAKERMMRDPISGSGVIQTETKSLWNCSNDYTFRSFLNPKHGSASSTPNEPYKDFLRNVPSLKIPKSKPAVKPVKKK